MLSYNKFTGISMQWKQINKNLSTGSTTAEIRSILIPDEYGNLKRHRVTTCWNPAEPKFSKTSATGKLAKDDSGKIGIIVYGKNNTYIKVGKFNSSIPYIVVAINCISKKPRKKLLKGVNIELVGEGNFVFGIEK